MSLKRGFVLPMNLHYSGSRLVRYLFGGGDPVVYSSLFHTVINRNLVQSRYADAHLASISNRVRGRLAPVCVQSSGRFTVNFTAIFALRTGIVLPTNILRRSAERLPAIVSAGQSGKRFKSKGCHPYPPPVAPSA